MSDRIPDADKPIALADAASLLMLDDRSQLPLAEREWLAKFPYHISHVVKKTGFTAVEILNAIKNSLVTYYDIGNVLFLHPEDVLALSARDDYGFVYAVGFARYVKIGFTKDIESRLAQLQTAAPLDLTVYRTMRGCQRDERNLHARFKNSRLRGEWFMMDRPVAAWVRGGTE